MLCCWSVPLLSVPSNVIVTELDIGSLLDIASGVLQGFEGVVEGV